MKPLALIGYMATGKSTVAKALGAYLGYEVIDLDDYIEAQQAMAIEVIFSQFGEEYFRQIESTALQYWSQKENCIISTGGGVVVKERNRKLLEEHFFAISLWASPELILKRVKSDSIIRPLLVNEVDPIKTIETMLQQRTPWYQQAQIQIDTSSQTIDEVVQTIVKHLPEVE